MLIDCFYEPCYNSLVNIFTKSNGRSENLKNQFKRIIAVIVGLGMVSSPSTVSVFAEENNELGHYCGEGFEVSYTVKDNWGSNFIVDATVKNTTDTTIEDWCLR